MDNTHIDEYADQLEQTYAFAEKFGTIVFCSKVRTIDKKGKPVRAPLAELANRKHVKQALFSRMDDGASEYIPTIHLGTVGVKRFLCCVDIDIKRGKDGTIALREMFPEVLNASTIIEKTGTGGFHYYFLSEERLLTKSNGTSGMDGVDLLCENASRNPSLCFVPPAYGSGLDGRRHTWLTDPRETKIAMLPKSLLAYWRELSVVERKKEKPTEEPTATLCDVELFESILPNAIRRNSSDGQAIDAQCKLKLDEFLECVAPGSKWESGRCRQAWIQIGLVIKKLACAEQKRFDMFHVISSLMPDYEGTEDCLMAWNGLTKPRAGGTTLNRWKQTTLLREELAKAVVLKIGDMSAFEEVQKTETKIININDELLALIAARKSGNSFFRLADVANRLFEDGRHPLAALLFATSVFSATFQYDYAFKTVKKLGYAAPNTFVGIFAASGVGKQVLFDIYKRLVVELKLSVLADAKSTIGIFRQISGKPIPRDFLMLLDEMKSDGGFLLKQGRGSGSMDASLKKAHTKLYDGTLVGWVSKTEDEKEVQHVFETMFFATSYYEFADEYIQALDFEHGIGNRPLYYIAPEFEKKEDSSLSEYFDDTEEGVDTFESILDKFCEEDVSRMCALRNRFRRGITRDAFYRAKYPLAVSDAGEPLFEVFEAEQDATSKQKKMNADEKKKKEVELKKLINDTDVYDPVKLVLAKEKFAESATLLENLKKGQTEDDSATRKRLHGIKIALLIELGEDKYVDAMEIPKEVQHASVADAELIVRHCFTHWLSESERHTSAREDVTFNDIKETKLLVRVRKKIMTKLTKYGQADWKMLKALVFRDKEIRAKDDFFNFVRLEMGGEFSVTVDDSGKEVITKK